ncbi:MAG: hypothetical protein ACLRSQ_10500 [Coprobacillus cateniformis]|uniref:hypothetical protein n=1 Tax=Coprobacillus cateniformis TaxID=100884 RepID=UPI003990C49A
MCKKLITLHIIITQLIPRNYPYAYSTSAGYYATSSTGYREGANNWRTSGYTGTITNWGYDIATKYAGEHSHSVVINSCGGHSHVLSLTGSGNSQNLQPFMAVYIWVRIA